jgi:hypothetical protein
LQFAAFGSWKLPFQRYLQHFRVRTSHFPWYLQCFGAQTFHVGWYCATRVHLGYVKVCLSVYFGLVWGCFCFIYGWCRFFRVSFGVGLGLFRVGLGSM